MTSNDVTLYDVVVRLDRLTGHVISMDKRLEKVESRLDGVEIRLEKVEGRLDGVEVRLENLETRTTKLEALTLDMREQLLVTDARVEMLHHSMNWGFAIMGIIVALVGIVFAGVALFFSMWSSLRAEKKEKEQRERVVSEPRENYSQQILLR